MVERLAQTELQNKRLQEQLATVQDEERADLARDLHDEIGPLLFAADVDAVAIGQLVAGRRARAHPGARRHHPRGDRADAAARARHPRPAAAGRAARRGARARHRQSRVVLAGAPAQPQFPRRRWRTRASASCSTAPSTASCRRASATRCATATRASSRSRSPPTPTTWIAIRVVDDGGGLKGAAAPAASASSACRSASPRSAACSRSKNRADGRGVIVAARIPIRTGRAHRPDAGAAGDRTAMKILLVDDHIVVREGVRRLLSGMQGVELSRGGVRPGGAGALPQGAPRAGAARPQPRRHRRARAAAPPARRGREGARRGVQHARRADLRRARAAARARAAT